MDLFANRSTKAFAAQFERDGDGYLFRQDHVGALVRVTAQEREEVIAAFRDKFYDWRSFVISMVFATAVVAASHLPQGVSGKVLLIAFLCWIVTQHVISERAYRAPARRFADRASEGPQLTKEEARTVKDRQITWTAIALMGFFGALFTYWLSTSSMKNDTWVTLLMGPALLVMAPYGIFRKFRSA
jgi:hypothetical protein